MHRLSFQYWLVFLLAFAAAIGNEWVDVAKFGKNTPKVYVQNESFAEKNAVQLRAAPAHFSLSDIEDLVEPETETDDDDDDDDASTHASASHSAFALATRQGFLSFWGKDRWHLFPLYLLYCSLKLPFTLI